MTESPEQLLRRAVAHHQAGQLAAAEALYRDILHSQPRHWDALHMLGAIALARGDAAAAQAAIAPVVAARPRDAMARSNLGLALLDLGRPHDAAAQFQALVALRPGDADAQQQLGLALRQSGNADAARAAFEQAIRLRPDFGAAHQALGAILLGLGLAEAACASFERASQCLPLDATAPFLLGTALQVLQRPDRARDAYQLALARDPAHVDALNNLGSVFTQQQRFGEAEVSLRSALVLRPTDAEIHYNLGLALAGQQRLTEALACYDRALVCDRSYLKAHNNRALLLKESGRFDAALSAYDAALGLDADFPDARWNRSLLYLLTGRFGEGWRDYEQRWGQDSTLKLRQDLAAPIWTGAEPLAGRSILVHAEQGFGDSLQFVRYVPQLAARGARVVVEVQPELGSLLRSVPGANQVLARGEPVPACDFHIPMLSLPRAFDTQLATIPADIPYVTAEPGRVASWSERLAGRAHPRIGLAWAGNPRQSNDRNRSAPLEALRPLWGDGRWPLISLQKQVPQRDQASLQAAACVLDLASELHDFSDTAALIASLDLVITVDTAVAHLAGALGKPVWILLCHVPDWRYLLNRSDSPWYPSARLFRQGSAGDWQNVAIAVRAALDQARGGT